MSSQGEVLARLARQGNLQGVKSAVEQGFDINERVTKSKDTLLHLALSQNRLDLVIYILEQGAHVNACNEQGVTPLMVAVSSCRKATGLLIERGADPTRRSYKLRKTALDLAQHDDIKLILTHALRDVECTTDDSSCCPYCGVKLKHKSRLAYDLEFASENPYLREFLSTEACQVITTRPEYHVLTSKHHLKKEISESWAILQALAGLSNLNLHMIQLIDLCAGSSLTTTMFGLHYPSSKALAVDLMSEQFAPHLRGNLSYLQADIMKEDFTQTLKHVVETDELPSVLVGMHLCGDLSIRAIELFACTPQIEVIVLSPCCFPKMNTSISRMDTDSMRELHLIKDEYEKYTAWSRYLLVLLSEHCVQCFMKQDTNILSSRNHVVVGRRTLKNEQDLEQRRLTAKMRTES